MNGNTNYKFYVQSWCLTDVIRMLTGDSTQAYRHWMVAAKARCEESRDQVKEGYIDGD